MSGLTDSQIDRYARHIVLKEVGGAGQQVGRIRIHDRRQRLH